jgi:hypothetical protein
MPRYFFHLHDNDDIADEEGTELPDVFAAKDWAHKQALHMAAASITEHQRLFGNHRIDVEDQAGEVVFAVLFREVVEIKL